MSLNDIDKNNADRGTPKPNSVDEIIIGARKNHGTISSHYDANAAPTPGRLQMQNMALLANDGSNPRGLYGWNKAMGLWGFFLTKIGVDVTTNTDTSQFIFNSNQDVFKIVSTGTATITVPDSPSAGGSYTTTIVHGLGFVPAFLAFVTLPLGGADPYQQLPWFNITWDGSSSFKIDNLIVASATTTNIDFAVYTGNSSVPKGNCVFKYYILQETAN